MAKDTFLITVPPGQFRALQGWDAVPACLAYCLGQGGHLLRAQDAPSLKGGWMVIGDRNFDGFAPLSSLCQEIFREMQGRNFSGLILDFERRLPPLEQLTSRLDEIFTHRGWPLYVPEAYGLCTTKAGVVISSALSGGTLEGRLREAGERFGRDRVVLALEKSAEDFRLPSPTGCGTPLSRRDLETRMARLRPSVFFSRELCARYFTYMDREDGAHFVLFDDGDTLRQKVELARRAGVDTFLLPLNTLEEHGAQLGIRRLPQSSRKGS